MTSRTSRVVINESSFRALVKGQVVFLNTVDGDAVELILSDIGWDRMIDAIADAMAERTRRS